MDNHHMDVITHTFGLIEDGDALILTFYDELFQRYPNTEHLFIRTDWPVQRRMVLAAITFAVQNVRHPDILKKSLRELGQRHEGYGTKPGDYALVGEALLKALALHLGEHWTAEVETAWIAGYTDITNMVIGNEKSENVA
ncbi:MAG: hypothetical protein OHK0046_52130 [Anaerolineae bacterium]